MVDLTVVLPAYNEAAGIPTSLRRLLAYLEQETARGESWRSWEAIVVDDGSTDGTAAAAKEAAGGPELRVVELPGNQGKWSAVVRGIRESRGEFIVVTDVDLSYAVQDIGAVWAKLHAGLDVVTGDRRHPESRMDLALSALGHVVRRQAVSAAFNAGVRLIYRLPWRDTQCGLKGFRREPAAAIVRRLRTGRFLADIEIFLIAGRLGLRVGTIPVHLTYLSGDSTVSVLRHAPAVVADALRIRIGQMRRAYDGDAPGR